VSPTSHRHEKWIAGVLIAVGLLLNVAYAYRVAPLGTNEVYQFQDPAGEGNPQKYLHSDAGEYITLGYNLVHGYGLAAPLEDPKPSAYRMPGYPLLLSVLFAPLGARLSLALFIQCVLLAAIFWVTYRLARLVFSEKAALLALGCLIFWPNLKFYGCAYLGSETLATLCFYGFLLALLSATLSSGDCRWPLMGVSAALLGLAVMSRPDFLLFLPLLFVWLYRHMRARFTAMALYAAVVACFLAPWTVRNYRVFDAFIPTTTGMGNVLVGAYHPDTIRDNPGGWNRIELGNLEGLPPDADDLDEADLNLAKRREGLRYMGQLDLRDWARLAFWKMARLWIPVQRVLREQSGVVNLRELLLSGSLPRSSLFAITAAATLVCLPVYVFFWVGMRGAFSASRSTELLVYVFVFVNLVALAFWGSLRFRFIFEPILIVIGCHAIAARLPHRERFSRARSRPGRHDRIPLAADTGFARGLTERPPAATPTGARLSGSRSGAGARPAG